MQEVFCVITACILDFLSGHKTKDVTAADSKSPGCGVPCSANEALCDLLLLEGQPVATRKRPGELVRNIKLVRSSFLRVVAPQETLGLEGTVFQMDNTAMNSCR